MKVSESVSGQKNKQWLACLSARTSHWQTKYSRTVQFHVYFMQDCEIGCYRYRKSAVGANEKYSQYSVAINNETRRFKKYNSPLALIGTYLEDDLRECKLQR